MDEIVIVVPFYNNETYTRQIIDEVKTKTHIPYKLVLVDNGSTDETDKLLDEIMESDIEHIRLISNSTNLGVTKAWNQGIDTIPNAKYYAILNNDLLLLDNWLERLIDITEKEKQIGIISPFPLDSCYCDKVSFPQKASEFAKSKAGEKMDGLQGCCFIVRGEVFTKIGKFDEQFIQLFSDFDICVRTEQAGYETRIVFDNIVYHYGAKTQVLFKKEARDRYYSEDGYRYFRKHGYPKGKYTMNSGKVRLL